MSDHKISAASRKDEGKGASRRLRHAGQVPAIVYGGHADPQSIQLEHERTWLVSQSEWFYSSILDLEVDGKSQKVVAYCTHPVLSGAAIDNLDKSQLDELVVTDTIPLTGAAKACGRIRQLSVAELLAETVRRIAFGESVSSLYVD